MAGFLGKQAKKKLYMPILVLAVMLCLFGCGRKEKEPTEKVAASKEYVYKLEDLVEEVENQSIGRLYRAGDDIYLYGYSWGDDGMNSALSFRKLSDQGEIEEEYLIPLDADRNVSYINMDDEGNLYCIVNDYYPVNQGAEGEEGEEYVDWETEYVDDYYLTKMTLSGEEIFSVKLNDLPEIQKLNEANGYFYIRDMIYLKGKGVFVNSYNTLFQFDFEGNLIQVIEGKSDDNLLDSASSFDILSDGRCIATIYDESGMSVALVDLETASIQEQYKIPGRSYEYSLYAGVGYDLYLTNTYGVYGYNLGDQEATQLMGFIDSDLDVNRIYQVMGLDEKTFLGMYDNLETGNTVIGRFTKVPPEEVKDRQAITLAMPYSDWNVRRAVIKFNKENEQYKISILDYSSLYGSDEDYMASTNKFHMDLASGKVPDIVMLDDSMPIDSYINKGLFEDLKPYIERDSEFQLEDFMPNVLEAFSTDGKLYALVPSYRIQTVVAKASDVGEERGWTVQEAQELLQSKPEGTMLLESISRGSMLEYCMSMSGNQFVDWEKGTCQFDSDAFVEMLEFIELFPEEVDDTMFTDDYWNNYDSMWRDGRVIASVEFLSDFRSYQRIEKAVFGEKITMIGFPSANEEGSVIRPDMQLTMSSKSSCKDGVWEFLRIFLSDEYQKENIYDFPLSVKRLNELAEEAMNKPYYIDENGNKEEYDDVAYIGGQDIVIPPMTQEEADAFMEQLYSFTQVYKVDETLVNIIAEEAAPYFAGQKNAKDVAAVIQSRVRIYVNENR